MGGGILYEEKCMKNCIFYEITHKRLFYSTPKNYLPILVGEHKPNLPYFSDGEGENIADKNATYCELTAWYWLWKNCSLPDYLGLCHYRRFFVKQDHNLINGGVHLLNITDVNSIMTEYDVILPKKIDCGMSVKEFYYNHGEGKKKDIEACEDIIRKIYPDYVEDMQEVFEANSSSYWNLGKSGDYGKRC